MIDFINANTVASMVEDSKESANVRFDTGFTAYGEDALDYAVTCALEDLTTYTRWDIENDDPDATIDTARDDVDTYYMLDDVVRAIDEAWRDVEVSVDNLIYTQDGVDIAQSYGDECWDALTGCGYSLEDFVSLDSLLFTAAQCYVDHALRDAVEYAFDALKNEVSHYGV